MNFQHANTFWVDTDNDYFNNQGEQTHCSGVQVFCISTPWADSKGREYMLLSSLTVETLTSERD